MPCGGISPHRPKPAARQAPRACAREELGGHELDNRRIVRHEASGASCFFKQKTAYEILRSDWS
eukprot:COSAG04_NODE_8015_length_1034_cov_1.070588_1_plen_63_part_10